MRIQEHALALLEVAMWVALTQHQTGREMVSFMAGLERGILATVDMCALGMTDEDERSHCRSTTLMTNDSVMADAFRPCRCARDHKHVSFAGGRRSRRAQEHPGQFYELLVIALKASLLRRDRREPSQLMTLSVRNDDEQDEDSGLDEDEASTDNQHPTEAQIKMMDQHHRHLGLPSRREFLKVLKAVHAKPAFLDYVRREYRCADCDAHSKPQPSRKAAIPSRAQSLLVLNNICHGTKFQVAALMQQDETPMAAVVWSTGVDLDRG